MRASTLQFRCVATTIVALTGMVVSAPSASVAADGEERQRPNVVLILCDDLGYGDVRYLNPEGKIATPNMDRVAREGMVFTDAHSSASVCTPTRYGLLTGRYNWRSRLKSSVLGGMSPSLIEEDRPTLASVLRKLGYHTACIGKWHLGMDWALQPGAAGFRDEIEQGEEGWRADFSQPFRRGPTSFGFDYYFGISASLDMVPYTFLENDRVTVLPAVDKAFPMMLGRTPAHTRRGPAAEDFEAQDVLPELSRAAVQYIRERGEDPQRRPFFLYLPLASPHTPIVPTDRWHGRSWLNPYADFVMQTDDVIGQVLAALDQHELTDQTLIVVTSDNGCSPQADFPELLALGHNPNYIFRGHKADIYEGGHRVPLLVRWPGKITPGRTSSQLICLNDWMATLADITGYPLPDTAGEDSVSFLPLMLDETDRPVRETLVHHSINGSFAIRHGDWKLCLCPGSGGWSSPRPGAPEEQSLPPVQLYNLRTDIGETTNLAAQHQDVVQHLTRLMDEIRDEQSGSSD